MNDLAAIAYASKAARPLDSHDLDGLLIDARAFNEKVQVTGALLHHQGAFFQYFEGPPAAVARVYERIKESRAHHHLLELLNQPTDARQFARWHMAFTETPATVLQELGNEIWEMTLPGLHDRQIRSPGLELLLNFWNTVKHSHPSS
jgi:Sensors of blue-light using FAD